MESFGAHLGVLEDSEGLFCIILGTGGRILGPLGAFLGALGRVLGGSWEHFGCFWGVFWCYFGAFGVSLERCVEILKNLGKHYKVLQKSRFDRSQIQ